MMPRLVLVALTFANIDLAGAHGHGPSPNTGTNFLDGPGPVRTSATLYDLVVGGHNTTGGGRDMSFVLDGDASPVSTLERVSLQVDQWGAYEPLVTAAPWSPQLGTMVVVHLRGHAQAYGEPWSHTPGVMYILEQGQDDTGSFKWRHHVGKAFGYVQAALAFMCHYGGKPLMWVASLGSVLSHAPALFGRFFLRYHLDVLLPLCSMPLGIIAVFLPVFWCLSRPDIYFSAAFQASLCCFALSLSFSCTHCKCLATLAVGYRTLLQVG